MVSTGCKKDPEPTPDVGGDGYGFVLDVAREASAQAHTFESIQALIDGYARSGLRQIYIKPIPDTYAVTDSCQGSVVCDPSIASDHMHRTVHAVLDPNLAFMQAARRAGMQVHVHVHVLYSPYEGGGSVSIPVDAEAQFSFGSVSGIGGTSVFCSEQIQNSKNQLVTSIQYENASVVTKGKAERLEVVFAAQAFQNRVSQNETVTLMPDAGTEIRPVLWHSTDNINYTEVSDLSFTVSSERRAVTDPNGTPLGEMDCNVVSMDVSDVSNSRYFAVTFENGDALYTIPFSMIGLYTKDGEALTTTQAVYTRNPHSDSLLSEEEVPDDYIWGAERHPIPVTDRDSLTSFRAWGFEYQYGGTGADFGDGWHNGFVYGIAIGAQNQLSGNLCEGFASVREYWLGQVDRFYAKGADSVIITLENSGGMVYNYRDFGYNYFYVKEFSQRYGQNLHKDSIDYLDLMELRGSYFSEFLKGVDEVAAARQKQWGVQLFSAFEAPALDDDLNGLCHYRLPKILYDWKAAVDLCDIVLIADYQFGGYQNTVASGIRTYAAERSKTVEVMGYSACGVDGAYLTAALGDPLNRRVVVDDRDVCFAALASR